MPGPQLPDRRVDIAVVGSCNLDLVVGVDRVPRVGETVLGGDLQRIPGGKGANQAVAAARQGAHVAMVGRVGDDDAGRMLRAALEKDGVDTGSLLETSDTPSGVALIAVQADGDNAIVVSPGANGRITPMDIESAGVVRHAAAVLLQGEIPMDAIVEAATTASGTVVWNPAPAPVDGVPAELLESVDVLVPNQSELALLAGFESAVDVDTAQRLAGNLPAASVVVTLGSDGALVVVGGESLHIDAPLVKPVDTTAAGDSFCGALAERLVAGDDLVAATRWAVRVGAATTLRPGAQPSLPTRDEVDHLLS